MSGLVMIVSYRDEEMMLMSNASFKRFVLILDRAAAADGDVAVDMGEHDQTEREQ